MSITGVRRPYFRHMNRYVVGGPAADYPQRLWADGCPRDSHLVEQDQQVEARGENRSRRLRRDGLRSGGPVAAAGHRIGHLRQLVPIRSSKQSHGGRSVNLFGGSEVKERSEHLTHADVRAIFGGATLDLREAQIDEEATVYATALFGGVDVLVPEGCRVKFRCTPIFGGNEDKTQNKLARPEEAPTPKVNATSIFGAAGWLGRAPNTSGTGKRLVMRKPFGCVLIVLVLAVVVVPLGPASAASPYSPNRQDVDGFVEPQLDKHNVSGLEVLPN